MNGSRAPLPFDLALCPDLDCRVCGLGNAFAAAEHYDVCVRCGWVDDPDANTRPDQKSDTNETSLNEAIRRWPSLLVESLSKGPQATFAIVPERMKSADTTTSLAAYRFAECSTRDRGISSPQSLRVLP